MANIFLYGTLCDLELLQICLGRSLDKIDKQPARLDNHSVFWVKGRNFPVIKFVEGASAQGIVLFDLSNDDLNRLDFYEGSFNYELRKVSIYIENKKLSKDYNYSKVKSLSLEAIDKLNKIKPTNIGQASRISGVSPADISVLIIHFTR